MPTKKGRARPRHQGNERQIRVARGSADPCEDVPYFLTDPLVDPEDDARRLFPGAYASQRYLRSSFLEIVSALASSASGAGWLEKARYTIGPELQDLDSRRPTFVEGALIAGGEKFTETLRAIRRAAGMIRRARQLAPRRRRQLRIVS